MGYMESASQPVKKRRALFSSVDSPSEGKRFLVHLVLFFNKGLVKKYREGWAGAFGNVVDKKHMAHPLPSAQK